MTTKSITIYYRSVTFFKYNDVIEYGYQWILP